MAAPIGPAPVGVIVPAVVGGEDVVAVRRPAEGAIVEPPFVPAPGPEVDEALRQLERMLPGPKDAGLSRLAPPERENDGEWGKIVARRSGEMVESEGAKMRQPAAVEAATSRTAKREEKPTFQDKTVPAESGEDVGGERSASRWRAVVLALFATMVSGGARRSPDRRDGRDH
jgi:hypothetical protein